MELGAKYWFYSLVILACGSKVYGQVDDRLIGGSSATDGQFPYQVSLQLEGRQHRCGGGIIHERFILTAAHYVTDDRKQFEGSRFKVLIDTTDLNEPRKGRNIDVEIIYIPESYWLPVFRDDIAVLKLRQDIGLRNGLSKLELPKDDQTYVGQIAKVAGFGWFQIKDWRQGATDYKLKYLDVKILANQQCKIEPGTIPSIYDTNICGQAVQPSNGDGAGICNGDSGGPLVIGNTVIGIVSLGTTACRENLAFSRYTRVSSFVLFIDDVLRGIRAIGMRVHNVDGRSSSNAIVFPDSY